MAEIQDICVVKADPWNQGGWQAYVVTTEVSLDDRHQYSLSIILCCFLPDGSVRITAKAW